MNGAQFLQNRGLSVRCSSSHHTPAVSSPIEKIYWQWDPHITDSPKCVDPSMPDSFLVVPDDTVDDYD